MRITLLSLGSRGDVQPLLGFGLGLAAAGNDIRVAAFPRFERQVTDAGFEFAPLAEGRISRGATAEDRRVAQRGSHQTPALVALVKDAHSVLGERLADALSACEGADVIVTNELALLLGWQASEHSGAQLVRARLCPPPRMAQNPAAPAVRQTRVAGDASLARGGPTRGRPAAALLARAGGPDRRPRDAGAARVQPGGRARFGAAERLDAGDRLLVSRGRRRPRAAAGAGAVPRGGPAARMRWLRQHDRRRSAGHERARGRGATASRPARRADSRRSGLRRGAAARQVHAVGAISHDWLFERCSAVVHHGGAGTTATALKAGVPSVVVPHMIDQVAWGRTIHALGAGPAPIRRRKLSPERLHEAIAAAVTDVRIRERAAALGDRIRAEDGIKCAVEVFEKHMQQIAGPSALELSNG